MDISIIIPNYESERFLPSCIKSLRDHLIGVEYELIVINNDIATIKTVLETNDLIIINNKNNNGFGSACNAGANEAKGNFLFFLNPDTEIVYGSISDLLKKLNDPTIGVVSPALLIDPNERQPWSAGHEITLWETIRSNIGIGRSERFWVNNEQNNPDWVSGAAFAIKSSLFKEIGGFDEKFFMYFEDVDLCKRIRARKLKISILPSIQILHLGGQSFSDTRKQKKYYYASQDYYFKKHFGQLSSFFLKELRNIALLFKKN